MSTISEKPVQPPLQPNQPEAVPGVPGGQIEEAAKHAAANVSQGQKVQDDFVQTPATAKAPGTGQAIPPPGLPPVNATADEAEGAAVLADTYNDAMAPVLAAKNDDVAKLSAENLLKFFMMLNILDPNNQPETQKDLIELQSNMRQQAIENVRKEIENLKQKLAEAEKKAKMWGFISNLMTFLNPLGLISKKSGDNSTMSTLGGVLAPEQMMVQMLGEDKAKGKVDALKKELEGAERRLAKVEYHVSQMDKERRKKFEREQQEAIDTMKAETASAGADGVPLRGLAQKLKGKIGAAMQALQAIAANEGPQAMMAAAPGAFQDAILPLLVAHNIKDAEAKGNEIVDLLVQQLAQGTLGAKDPNQVIGPMTTLLAEKLDPDSQVDADQDPVAALIAAHLETMAMLKSWAESQASSAHQMSIHG